MIENPGETPDFAIFASLNKRRGDLGLHLRSAVDPESTCGSGRSLDMAGVTQWPL